MKHPFFSIIMPVYNSMEWLPDSISSIISQSYPNWELICVNDGSDDKSLDLLTQSASVDSRIHILDQPNSGVSVARNNGITAAKGDYIMFLDSDDFFDSNALEILSQSITDSSPDLIIVQLREIDQNYHFSPSLNDSVAEVIKASLENILEHATPYVTDKVYKSEIIRTRNLLFDPLLTYTEDFHFWYRFAMQSEKIVKLGNFLYSHRLTPNSLSGRFLTRWQTCTSEELKKNLCLLCHLGALCDEITNKNNQRIYRKELLVRATDFHLRTGKVLFKLKGKRRYEALKAFHFSFRLLTKDLSVKDLLLAIRKGTRTIYSMVRASIRYHFGH